MKPTNCFGPPSRRSRIAPRYSATSTDYAQWLYQRAAGSYALRVKRQSTQTWQEQEPDISATLSTGGKMVRILAVNVRLEGFSSRVAKGSMTVIKDRDAAGTGEVMNPRDDPGRVVPHAVAFEPQGIPFGVTFAPFALTVLEISLSQ